MLAPLLFFVLLVIPGCATHGNESIREREADWPPLTMTKSELLATLGKPMMRSVSVVNGQTREIITWSYADTQMNPALFVPVVGLFVAGSGNGVHGQSKALSTTFLGETMVGKSWVENQIGK